MPRQPQIHDIQALATSTFAELEAAVAELGVEVNGLVDDVLDKPEPSSAEIRDAVQRLAVAVADLTVRVRNVEGDLR